MNSAAYINQNSYNTPAGTGVAYVEASHLSSLLSNHAMLQHGYSQNANAIQKQYFKQNSTLFDLRDVREDLVAYHSGYNARNSEMETLQLRCEIAESEREVASSFYSEAEHRITTLKGDLSKAHEERDRLARVHSNYKLEQQAKLAISEKRCDTLSAELRSATAAGMFVTRRAEKAEKTRDMALEAVAQKEVEVSKARERITLADAKVESLVPEVKKLTLDNHSLQAERDHLTEALLQSQANIDSERARTAAAAAQAEVFSTQITYTAQRNAIVEAENAQLKTTNQDAALSFDAVKLERDMLLGQEEELAARNAGLTKQLRATSSQAACAASRSHRTTSERDAAHIRAHHLAAQLADSQRDGAAAHAEVARLKAALADITARSHAERAEHKVAAAGAQDTAHALNIALDELAAQKRAGAISARLNGSLRAQLHAAQGENKEIKTQLHASNAEITELKTHLAAERAAHSQLLAEVDAAQVQAAEKARAEKEREKENTLAKAASTPRVPAKRRFSRVPSLLQKAPLRTANADAPGAFASSPSAQSVLTAAALAPVTSRVSASSERTPTPGSAFAFTFTFGGASASSGLTAAKGGAAFSSKFLKRMMGRSLGAPQGAVERNAASVWPALA